MSESNSGSHECDQNHGRRLLAILDDKEPSDEEYDEGREFLEFQQHGEEDMLEADGLEHAQVVQEKCGQCIDNAQYMLVGGWSQKLEGVFAGKRANSAVRDFNGCGTRETWPLH